MEKNIKFKFYPHQIDEEFLDMYHDFEQLEVVPFPFAASAKRNGYYHVRYHHGRRGKFLSIGDTCYMFPTEEVHIASELILWNLIPSLPHKEWVSMMKHAKRLAPKWQQFLDAYFYRCEEKELYRETMLFMYRP